MDDNSTSNYSARIQLQPNLSFKKSLDFSIQSTWFIIILGQCSILLNLFVITVIMVHRKSVLKNVFYMLVLHCSFVDLLRAVALTAWCLPVLNIFSFQTVIQMTNAKKWMVLFLQSFNLLTVINLLIFTLNEYIVVVKPLQYRRMNRRRLACICIVISWVASVGFAIGYAVIRLYTPTSNTVYISRMNPNGTNGTLNRDSLNRETLQPDYAYYDVLNGDPDLVTNPVIYNIYQRNLSFISGYPDSSAKRPRKITRDIQAFDETQYSFSFAVIGMCVFCVITVITCYSMILKEIKNFKNCTEFKVVSKNIMKIHGAIMNSGNRNSPNGSTTSNGKSGQKHIQAILRHKYVIVIGSVLAIDVLFLIPYATVRILQYVNVAGLNENLLYRPRLILQFIIVLHMVLQPLCYFRMGEFRKMAACKLYGKSSREISKKRDGLTAFRQSLDMDNLYNVDNDPDTITTPRTFTSCADSVRTSELRNIFQKKLCGNKYYSSVNSSEV